MTEQLKINKKGGVGPRYLPNKTPNKDGTISEIRVPNPRHPSNAKYFENRPGKKQQLIKQGY